MADSTRDTPRRLLTVKEAAAILNISERQLRRLIAEGTLAVHHLGRAIRIAPAELRRYLAQTRSSGGTGVSCLDQ